MRLRGVSRKTKRAREALDEIDYVEDLSTEDRLWLRTFMRAEVNQDIDAMADLVGGDKIKLGRLQQAIYREDNAARRDITYTGVRTYFEREEGDDEEDTESVALHKIASTQFQWLRCDRCGKRDNCTCPTRERHTRYSADDYAPVQESEDSVQAALDLEKRMQAYDLLPYGKSPKGLQQGHAVKICLPWHHLDKAWGWVLDYCPLRGAYLIRSMGRPGLRNRDGSEPKATVCWVKPEGLRRHSLKLLPKEFENGPDKISSKGGLANG